MPLRRLWNSNVLGAISSVLIAAFTADMISLQMFRPTAPEPERGFVVAEGARIAGHLITFYVSRLDQLLELALFVAGMSTLVASLKLRQRGR